jgi:hypothetical protein
MRHICYRNEFTAKLYEQYQSASWLIKSEWGQRESGFPFAKLHRADSEQGCPAAGSSLLSVLPMLGMIAGLDCREEYALSIEELGHLSGVGSAAVRTVMRALELRGCVRTWVAKRRGKWLTHWSVTPKLSAAVNDGRADSSSYFYFPMRLLYGANWAAMTRTQRALYVAAATHARVYRSHPSDNPLLRDVLRDSTPLDDLERTYFANCAASEEGGLRLACVSVGDMSAITGMSRSTLSIGIQGLKHPAQWPESSRNQPSLLKYFPIWVYPTTAAQSLIYAFRDDVSHVPWEVANASTISLQKVPAALLSQSASAYEIDPSTIVR